MNNNYICHYGVKGMKWGVRHDQNRTTTEHKVLTGRNIALGIAVAGGALSVGVLLKKGYSRNFAKDIVLKGGQEVSTMTSNIARTKNAPVRYASFKSRDLKTYNRVMGGYQMKGIHKELDNLKSVEPGNTVFASTSSGKKIYNYLLKNDASFAEGVKNMKREHGSLVSTPWGKSIERIMTSMNGGRMSYSKFNTYLDSSHVSDVNKKTIDTFSRELKKRGYAGVLDEHDTRVGFSSKPLIITDTEKYRNTTVTKVKPSVSKTLSETGKMVVRNENVIGTSGAIASLGGTASYVKSKDNKRNRVRKSSSSGRVQ